ncbi:MAG: hypothetical protein FWC01_06965 [Treponema sp.]|nr:hypothetical protein [Treponema sp.]MCL2237580.1 hypothetical protein [Treponema sp.]
MEKFEQIIQAVKDWLRRLSDEQRKRLALICTAVFAVILTISVLMSIERPEKEEKLPVSELFNRNIPVPAEELFLPGEPDYIPGVILERDKRSSWTEEDAKEFWQDPLRYGEEQWREKIEGAINEYMERVP